MEKLKKKRKISKKKGKINVRIFNIILTFFHNPEHCKRVKSVAESWQLSVNIIALDEDPGIRHRALVFLKNISEHDIEIAESLSKIDVKDILIGMSKNLDAAFTEEFDDNHRRLLSSLSTDVLKIWQDHNLITLQG